MVMPRRKCSEYSGFKVRPCLRNFLNTADNKGSAPHAKSRALKLPRFPLNGCFAKW